MTREEAKEILTHNWTRVDNPNYSESELDEAFFMAIEALSVANLKSKFESADAVSREFYEDAVKANIGLVMENRELKEQIESAAAVQIHNDGTLEVKVPNAQKVGRVLVMDTEHDGGEWFDITDMMTGESKK